MDDEEISESELTDLIKRFEQELANNRFDYYAQHQLVALVEFYFDHSSYHKAMEVVELAIQQHPFYAGFLAKKAFIYTIEESPLKALEQINRALDLEPGNPEYLTQKGSIYELLGQPLKALDLFDEAIEQGAFLNDVLVLKMFVYYNLGNNELALSMIERLFSQEIDEDRLVMEAHFCLQLMEAYAEGIRIMLAYTNIDPFQEVVWFHLGQLYVCNEQYDEAINAFEFATAIDETYAEPLMERGCCFLQLERFTDAASSFKEYIEIDGPDRMVCTQLGDCYRMMEQFQKSRTYYRQALKMDAKYAPAWHGLGQSFMDEGRFSEALPFLNKSVKLNPDDEYLLLDLATTQMELDYLDLAETTLIGVTQNSPTFKPIWYLLASLYHERGDTTLAIFTLEKGMSKSDRDGKSLYKVAAYYFLMGDAIQGYNYLTDGLLIDFDNHTILFEEAPFLSQVKAVNDIIDLYKKN